MRAKSYRRRPLCLGLLGLALMAAGATPAGATPAGAARAPRAQAARPTSTRAAHMTLTPGSQPAPPISQRTADAPAYVPGEVIVGYRSQTEMTADELALGVRHAAAAPAPHSRLLRLPHGESVKAALARLRGRPGIAYAEPNYIAHAAGEFYPDDEGRARRPQGWERLQWNLLPASGINATEAWSNLFGDHRPGGRGVVVAVLDTGVAYRNYKQFRISPDFGATRFVAPYDFVAGDRYPLDRNGHGTFVAGVIAESTNNRVGLTGIAYGVKIMPVRVLDAGGEGDETTIARGIRYAVRHGAQVINLSLEFLPSQVSSAAEIPQILSAISYARRRGVTVVGASGNDETDQIAYPARAPGVISVGATTRDRCLAAYSNGGLGLDLVAPGGGDDAVRSSDPNCHPGRNLPSIYQLTLSDPPHWGRFGYPGFYIGTSMSSPEVAAAAALVIASRVIGRHPSPDQILARLEATASPLPAGGPVPNADYGYGLLNVGAATARGGPIAPPPPAPTDSPGTSTQPGTTTTQPDTATQPGTPTQPSSGGVLTPN